MTDPESTVGRHDAIRGSHAGTFTGAVAGLLLAGCAAQYNPDRAFSMQDQLRNSNPRLDCPAGSMVACDIEGGAIVGKTYSNCRCIR